VKLLDLDRTSHLPLHVQLLNYVRHTILSGAWAPGQRLPSEPELAEQLAVSRSTVRQALQVAEQEGLIHRVQGRGTFVASTPISRQQRQLLGFVVPYFRSSFDNLLLLGAESVARERGYQIIFCNSRREVAEENRLLRMLNADGVTGIILWPAMSQDDELREAVSLMQNGVSLALMDRPLPHTQADIAISDNFGGAYHAVQHLITLGHRSISFLSHSYLYLEPLAERLRGYRQAMLDAGLTPRPPITLEARQEMETDYALRAYTQAEGEEIRKLCQLLRQSDRPQAIFAMNDLMALQVMKAASLCGISIPSELSLVGFDDLDVVSELEVPLTTVMQTPRAIGREATSLVLERIAYPALPPRRRVLPTRLVVRASTAPPGAQADRKRR